MNTTELAAKIVEAHSVSKAQAKSIVDEILKDIVDAAASGAEVSLPGLGRFKVKETPEREGRNPASGEKIKDGSRRRRSFDCRQGSGGDDCCVGGSDDGVCFGSMIVVLLFLV